MGFSNDLYSLPIFSLIHLLPYCLVRLFLFAYSALTLNVTSTLLRIALENGHIL